RQTRRVEPRRVPRRARPRARRAGDRIVIRRVVVAAVVAATVGACTSGGGGTGTTTTTAPTTTTTTISLATSLCRGQVPQQIGTLADPALVEASGVVESRARSGVLWVHNDSGDTARVFAITKAGATVRQ